MHRLPRWIACLCLSVAAYHVEVADAVAQAKLEARYVASLTGVPIGRGAWVVEVGEDHYLAAASGASAGAMRMLTTGKGTSAARGTIANGQFLPTAYASSVISSKKVDDVRMTIAASLVRDVSVIPPVNPNPERIPITEAHRRGVVDPMTASLTRTPGTGDAVSPQACERTTHIFDGRMRYDLRFSYKRMDKVKSEKGYAGPVVVCSVQFTPVAGYIPDRPVVTYLSAQRDIEVWLAPIGGTRVLAPYRVDLPTPIGHGLLLATQFVTTPLVTPASAKVP